jgi:hypothetical protein
MVVVLTAPIPTRRMPSFPAGSAIFGEFFTIWNYIIKYQSDGDWVRTTPAQAYG